MTIEFADPGYNFGLMWCGIGLTLLGIVLFWLPFFFFAAPMIFFPWAGGDYSTRVAVEKGVQLADAGFDNVSLIGDRFTAATEDGQYFEGVLVDLRPESGYAYRVLELTETGD
jgi:hypothetical protein